MAYTAQEIQELVSEPQAAFSGLAPAKRTEWVSFVCSVDEAPKEKHPLLFYASVGRAMVELLGSAEKDDYADPHMRSQIIENIKSGAQPFAEDPPGGSWQGVTLNAAQVSLALRVQAKAQNMVVPRGAPSAPPVPDALAQALATFSGATAKDIKKGTLSFDFKARLQELGLSDMPRELIPSEESLIRLESMAKASREKGRILVGSAEGEDLMANFRPPWSRTPKMDVFVGDGSFEEKVKSALEAKRTRSAEDRVGFTGFPNFLGHVADWGFKMVITKAFSVTDFMAYMMTLVRVSEECGGVRVAYQYDLLLRQRMAQGLERGEIDTVTSFLRSVDREVLSDARTKLAQRTEEAARATARSNGSSGSAAGKPFNGAAVPKTPPGMRSRSPPGKGKNKGSKGKPAPWAASGGSQPPKWRQKK